MCRELRVQRGLKQREVAEAIGIKAPSYSNVESISTRVIGQDAANRLANFYGLDDAGRARLLAAWERTPLSEFNQRRQVVWQRRNRMRSKAKHHDRVFKSLIEVLGAFLPHVPDGQVCSCEFASDPCEVCTALENLGLNPFTTKERAIADLSALADKLEAKATQPADGVAP